MKRVARPASKNRMVFLRKDFIFNYVSVGGLDADKLCMWIQCLQRPEEGTSERVPRKSRTSDQIPSYLQTGLLWRELVLD